MGKKVDNIWNWEYRIIETEQCNIEKFGSKFRDIFSDKLDNLYCLSDVNVTIQGHTTYDVYSYFYVAFYPCVNGVNGRTNCKPYDEAYKKLGSTFLTVKMQDIELTPHLYKTPTQIRARELSAPVMATLYNNINAYFHIVNIQTDNDVLGFEALSKVDVKKFFKYDVTFMVTSINTDSPLVTGGAYCNILLQLTEQMITIDRTYTKLIEVLGDVGGLMEFIFSFLNILSYFLTETLYEKSLVNNLFSFNIDKKLVIIKPQKKNKKNNFISNLNEQQPSIFNPIKPIPKLSFEISIANEDTVRTKNILNEELNKNELNIKNNIELNSKNNINIENDNKVKIKKKKKKKAKRQISSSKLEKYENIEDSKSKNLPKKIIDENQINIRTKLEEEEIQYRKKKEKIQLNKIDLYLCFCCARKKKNLQNALINEGMKLISEKLDIINMFIKLHKDEKIQEKLIREDIIEMSDECKINIQNFIKSNLPKI